MGDQQQRCEKLPNILVCFMFYCFCFGNMIASDIYSLNLHLSSQSLVVTTILRVLFHCQSLSVIRPLKTISIKFRCCHNCHQRTTITLTRTSRVRPDFGPNVNKRSNMILPCISSSLTFHPCKTSIVSILSHRAELNSALCTDARSIVFRRDRQGRGGRGRKIIEIKLLDRLFMAAGELGFKTDFIRIGSL